MADGGSSDGTVELAAGRGCAVVRSPAGRGRQLRAGVAASQGDWLLVLHADARVSADALAEAEAALRQPGLRAAAWPLAIEGDEAFFTGTAAEVVAIRQVDGRLIGAGKSGPVTRDLRARFQALVRS